MMPLLGCSVDGGCRVVFFYFDVIFPRWRIEVSNSDHHAQSIFLSELQFH